MADNNKWFEEKVQLTNVRSDPISTESNGKREKKPDPEKLNVKLPNTDHVEKISFIPPKYNINHENEHVHNFEEIKFETPEKEFSIFDCFSYEFIDFEDE